MRADELQACLKLLAAALDSLRTAPTPEKAFSDRRIWAEGAELSDSSVTDIIPYVGHVRSTHVFGNEFSIEFASTDKSYPYRAEFVRLHDGEYRVTGMQFGCPVCFGGLVSDQATCPFCEDEGDHVDQRDDESTLRRPADVAGVMPLSDRTTRADGSVIDAARVTPPRPPFAAMRWAIMSAVLVGATWYAGLQELRDPFAGVAFLAGACLVLPVLACVFLLVRGWRNVLLVLLVWAAMWGTACFQKRWLEYEAIRAFQSDRYRFKFFGFDFALEHGAPAPISDHASYRCPGCWYDVNVRRDGNEIRAWMTD